MVNNTPDSRTAAVSINHHLTRAITTISIIPRRMINTATQMNPRITFDFVQFRRRQWQREGARRQADPPPKRRPGNVSCKSTKTSKG